jgi:hypothetical protein
MPIRSIAGFGGSFELAGDLQPAHQQTATAAKTPTAVADRRRAPRVRVRCIYLLLSGTSSTIAMQYPWGLTAVAFFTMVIFIVVS